MPKFILAMLLISLPAHAAIYAVTCTSNCIASDGTTQPAGTILNFVLWNGVSTYTATDAAGNTADVSLVLDAQGVGTVYQPATAAQPTAAQSETDCIPVASGTCTLPAGTGLTQWTFSGTLATYTVVLPSNPIVGPQSRLDVNLLGTGTITALAIQDSSGAALKTVSVTAPHVYRLEYTNSGWAVLPN